MSYVPFVFIFIFSVILFQYNLNRKSNDHTLKKEKFLSRERKSNFTPKTKINDELYITPSPKILPFKNYEYDENDIESLRYKRVTIIQENIKKCVELPMFKLAPEINNTILKETYGFANLDILISGEQNYNNYIKYLNNWADFLIQEKNYIDAKTVLEEALSIGSDVSFTYVLLISTYYETSTVDLNNFMKKINNRIDYPMSNIVYNKIIEHYNSLTVN